MMSSGAYKGFPKSLCIICLLHFKRVVVITWDLYITALNTATWKLIREKDIMIAISRFYIMYDS